MGCVISALWVMQKEIISRMVVLDVYIFHFLEDVGYCLRIWNEGFMILYISCITVRYYAQEISRVFKLNQAAINHIMGLIYYFKNHKCFLKWP